MPNHKDLKTVYLAGGFRSGWQTIVTDACHGFEYKDPSKHGLSDPVYYTAWDLNAIRESDIVFAYLEASNPGGYALGLEVGYAKALGLQVIFVDEKSVDPKMANRLAMIREAADYVFENLEDGMSALKDLA